MWSSRSSAVTSSICASNNRELPKLQAALAPGDHSPNADRLDHPEPLRTLRRHRARFCRRRILSTRCSSASATDSAARTSPKRHGKSARRIPPPPALFLLAHKIRAAAPAAPEALARETAEDLLRRYMTEQRRRPRQCALHPRPDARAQTPAQTDRGQGRHPRPHPGVRARQDRRSLHRPRPRPAAGPDRSRPKRSSGPAECNAGWRRESL